MGDFLASSWVYKGEAINFWRRPRNGQSKGQLSGVADFIARSVAVRAMLKKESASRIRGRLEAIKWLADCVGDTSEAWLGISASKLDRCVSAISKECAPASAYQRACSLGQVISYLNELIHRDRGQYVGFLPKRIKWRTKLKNPILSTLDRLSLAGQQHTARHYKPDLHHALGSARATIKRNPSLEPMPGADLIRLESLAFAMSLGLRVGEICTLPVDAYDTEETTGVSFVRVISEKGALPAARPVEKVWAPLLAEAYAYLLEQCASARSRAREIEENGFSFLFEELIDVRELEPLSSLDKLRLRLADLPENSHYFAREVIKAFDVPPSELATNGRYFGTTKTIVGETEARLVEWFDQRFSLWDWHLFARRFKGAGLRSAGDAELKLSRVASLSGAAKRSVLAGPYRKELEELLGALNRGRVPVLGSQTPKEVRSVLLAQWAGLRATLLKGRLDRVVDVAEWAAMLERRYRAYLGKHFRDNFWSQSEEIKAVRSPSNLPLGARPTALSTQLIVVWDYQFSGLRNKGIIPRPMLRHDLYNYLCGDARKETIFKRLDLRDASGAHVAITPHQIRHWVTTAKYRSGPSQMMIDLWMGRKPGQSRHYDHRTAKERAEAIRALYTSALVPDDHLGRKVVAWRSNKISEQEIELLVAAKLRVAHFVPWGTCSRELYVSPCSRGLMCLRGFGGQGACESFHVDPKDVEAKKNIEDLKQKYQDMLRKIEPNYDSMQAMMLEELNETASLDQHIRFMCDVIRGCDSALESYAKHAA